QGIALIENCSIPGSVSVTAILRQPSIELSPGVHSYEPCDYSPNSGQRGENHCKNQSRLVVPRPWASVVKDRVHNPSERVANIRHHNKNNGAEKHPDRFFKILSGLDCSRASNHDKKPRCEADS